MGRPVNASASPCARRTSLVRIAALLLAPVVPLGGCARPRGSTALSATFVHADGKRVVLDFWDAGSFRLAPEPPGPTTVVMGGEAYVVLSPAENAAPGAVGRVLHVGSAARAPGRAARAQAPGRAGAAAEPSLSPTALPESLVAAWGFAGRVQDVHGPRGTGYTLSVAQAPALAAAQAAVGVALREGMDMRLCGRTVDLLTAWWLPELCERGLAVVAVSGSARLAGPPGSGVPRPTWPPSAPIEDWRLPAAPRST